MIVKVTKKKENLVGDTVEKKKCFVIFGLKKKVMPIRHEKEEYEKKQDEKVVMGVKDDEEEGKRLSEEIEEVHRLGKYEERKICPLKITIRSQAGAKEILAGSWTLGRKEVYKNVWLRCNLNEEERADTHATMGNSQRKKKK
ncbi:hypothetical protein E2C01_051731 [Portunus trituberculatus]|uniref:Uncharacterized protein n=1 Tax=Portunus trituberculatus TaxID=210409 RepID=A0A5B7GMJ1_PORTR|nr:hypothetical protein [Portunus trituberculatus]